MGSADWSGQSYPPFRAASSQIPSLKTGGPGSDAGGMAAPDLSCPICDADLLLAGDERVGDVVYCSFCGGPCMVTRRPEKDDESEWEIEDDL